MNGEKPRRLSLAILDREKGVPELPSVTDQEYPLPAWYRAVREVPLEELGVEDICKACRQQIHPDHLVPMALRILQSNPLAGEMYEGELLVSLKSVAPSYWSGHADEASILKAAVEAAFRIDATTDDLRHDVKELLDRIAS